MKNKSLLLSLSNKNLLHSLGLAMRGMVTNSIDRDQWLNVTSESRDRIWPFFFNYFKFRPGSESNPRPSRPWAETDSLRLYSAWTVRNVINRHYNFVRKIVSVKMVFAPEQQIFMIFAMVTQFTHFKNVQRKPGNLRFVLRKILTLSNVKWKTNLNYPSGNCRSRLN
jgi:hypothetical protein